MKKVSKATIQTCEALERGGPMTAVQIGEALCIFSDTARHRMHAVVSAGLATICRTDTPSIVTVVVGWRDIVASREPVVEPKVMTRNSADLKIEYAARPRISGSVAGTVWQGLGGMSEFDRQVTKIAQGLPDLGTGRNAIPSKEYVEYMEHHRKIMQESVNRILKKMEDFLAKDLKK